MMGKDNLRFRQRPYGSKPIVFKRPDQWGHQPTSEEIALATDEYMKKGGVINEVEYYGKNPELVDEDTFTSTDEELNQILEENKV